MIRRALNRLAGFIPRSGNTQAASTAGYKLDDGKPRMDLIPASFFWAVATVLAAGLEKYPPRNWENGYRWGKSYAALLRHITAWWGGEDQDPDSGLPHLHHAACNIAFLIEFTETHPELDDRPQIRREP